MLSVMVLILCIESVASVSIRLVAETVLLDDRAKFRTSAATTANALPCSPALAASMEAFSDIIFICAAILSISIAMLLYCSIAVFTSVTLPTITSHNSLTFDMSVSILLMSWRFSVDKSIRAPCSLLISLRAFWIQFFGIFNPHAIFFAISWHVSEPHAEQSNVFSISVSLPNNKKERFI